MVGKLVEFIACFLQLTYENDRNAEIDVSKDSDNRVRSQTVAAPISWEQIPNSFDVSKLRQFRVQKSSQNDERFETWIFDEGVYNKNRNFRLFRSSKLGRTDELEHCDASNTSNATNAEIFAQSLVCNIDKRRNNVRVIEIDDFNDEIVDFVIRYADVTPFTQPGRRMKNADMQGSFSENSPFIEIDNFIRSIIQSDSDHLGRIRKWNLFPERQKIIYEIVGYRYCERLKRHHKSNNIKFIVDLRHRIYHQRCFDHECRTFEPTIKQLPDHTLPWLDMPDSFSDD